MLKLISPLKSNGGQLSCTSKTLGMRRGNKPRRPIYNPNEINALILYTPPEITAQERLLNKEYGTNSNMHT